MKTNPSANNSALLFIPDISGYSNFVNDTEINHAQHIIEELLDGIIDSNDIGLKVSEIEGDAIFFYREGKAPTVAELLVQVQKMFVNFHAHLKMYETHRICDCGACSTANELTLKFVAHYGPIAENKIKGRKSLFGKDVIIAHRLMKNNIDSNEYSLFTNSLLDACSTWVELPTVSWSDVENGSEEYESGAVKYCHISLTPLYEHIPEPKKEDFNLTGKMMDLGSYEGMIEAPIDLVLNVTSDMAFRHHWMTHIKDSDMLNSKITKNGSAHRCVVKGNESDPYVIIHDFERNNKVITFKETERKMGFATLYKLTEREDGHTHLWMKFEMKKNIIVKIFFNLFKKKETMKNLENGFAELNKYCKKLVAEGKQHSSRIILKESSKSHLQAV